MLKNYLISLLLIASSICHAKVITDEEIWVTLNSTISFKKNWKFYIEYTQLYFDYNRYSGVDLFRGAVGKHIGSGYSIWGGYAKLLFKARTNSKFPSSSFYEDRPFLQLIKNISKNSHKLTNRVRYEFRFFEDENDVAQRLRYLLRYQKQFQSSPWGFSIWDEYFYNTNTIYPNSDNSIPILKAGFNLNLAFVGVIYMFGEDKQHLIETGYLNNYNNGIRVDRNAHAWMTTLATSF